MYVIVGSFQKANLPRRIPTRITGVFLSIGFTKPYFDTAFTRPFVVFYPDMRSALMITGMSFDLLNLTFDTKLRDS